MRRLTWLAAAVLFLGSCSLYFAPPDPPPGIPVTGGTLLVVRGGDRAILSDPGRDQIVVIDLASTTIQQTIPLEPGDEPGRLVEDGDGRIHVALRRGGALVTLDRGAIVDRREVCAAPRGLAWQESGDLIHVACATGELVSLPAAGGDPVRSIRLERDLRDVIVDGDSLQISRFRSAELLRVSADGTIASRTTPPSVAKVVFDLDGIQSEVDATPAVAWRTVGLGGGRAVMVHQRATRSELSTQPGGYASGECFDGPIEVTATVFEPGTGEVMASRRFPTAQLPVDVAVSPAGDEMAIVLAGTRTVRIIGFDTLPMQEGDTCGFAFGDPEVFPESDDHGMPTAVAYTPSGRIVVQYDNAVVIRSPRAVSNVDVLELPGASKLDAGRRRFHEPTFAGLACASCHPEGREDGLTWDFDVLGPRRTQDIAGNLADRAPYHWDGDMDDLSMLVGEVLVGRMGGSPLTVEEERALPAFLFNIPAPAAPTSLDADAVKRGRRLFEDPILGCKQCHGGALYTNNKREDVGTGGAFKVPSLIGVGWRAPYIHDGCATTLRDRFGDCGGNSHGGAGVLDDAQLDDLLVFLESL